MSSMGRLTSSPSRAGLTATPATGGHGITWAAVIADTWRSTTIHPFGSEYGSERENMPLNQKAVGNSHQEVGADVPDPLFINCVVQPFQAFLPRTDPVKPPDLFEDRK